MMDYTFFAFNGNALETSTIFEDFTYPMGERTVRLTEPDPATCTAHVMWVNTPHPDVSFIAQWADLVTRKLTESRAILVLPFLPGARGDKDVPSPARVNAELIANTAITDLITIDPHSDVWLDTFRSWNAGVAIHEIDTARVTFSALAVNAINAPQNYRAVIAPDKGAVRRANAVAELLGVPVYVADKRRDPETGHITSYSFSYVMDDSSYLVVDDICDGGGTFGVLANSFPSVSTVDLWVTHGGFTKGWKGTGLERYRTIFTTDSLPSAVKLWLEHPERNRVAMTYLDPFINEIITNITERGN